MSVASIIDILAIKKMECYLVDLCKDCFDEISLKITIRLSEKMKLYIKKVLLDNG